MDAPGIRITEYYPFFGLGYITLAPAKSRTGIAYRRSFGGSWCQYASVAKYKLCMRIALLYSGIIYF
jgi:hypothetical protein